MKNTVARHATDGYNSDTEIGVHMIKSWLHKGLQDFYETGSFAGIQPAHEKKLRQRLELIDRVSSVQELNLRSLQLHQLKGDRAGIWSISVNGNWRLTFKFENGDAYILNYEDYH